MTRKPLDDLRVRQAIRLRHRQRDAIARAMRGDQPPIVGIIAPQTSRAGKKGERCRRSFRYNYDTQTRRKRSSPKRASRTA